MNEIVFNSWELFQHPGPDSRSPDWSRRKRIGFRAKSRWPDDLKDGEREQAEESFALPKSG